MEVKFYRPIIVVSKCLEFDNCRYNNQKLKSPIVDKLKQYVDFQPVCPEMAIGLGVPRQPIHMINIQKDLRLQEVGTVNDYTEEMIHFSENFLQSVGDVDGFILKSKSPSCGLSNVKIHNSGVGLEHLEFLRAGFFAKACHKFFPNIPKEDEGRLLNFKLREEFLTKIFLLSEFREIYTSKNISELMGFQAKQKYLFMSYSPHLSKVLGNLIAQYPGMTQDFIFDEYKKVLGELFSKPRKKGTIINACEHIFGYFKNDISKEEKQFFLASLELYDDGRIPLSNISSYLKLLAIRFNKDYLKTQSFLYPFPEELIELSSSGKVLDL